MQQAPHFLAPAHRYAGPSGISPTRRAASPARPHFLQVPGATPIPGSPRLAAQPLPRGFVPGNPQQGFTAVQDEERVEQLISHGVQAAYDNERMHAEARPDLQCVPAGRHYDCRNMPVNPWQVDALGRVVPGT